jgi:macrolide-specific efflux system membrane fusion protein
MMLLVLAGLAAVAGWLLWSRGRPDPLADFLTATVERGDIEESVLATGAIRPVKLVAVGAQVSGRLTSMHVKVGDTVHKGDIIAEIDDINQQNAVKMSQASLEGVRAQIREKEATLTRLQAALAREEITLAQKATSRDSYENAQMQVRQTIAQIDQMKAQEILAQVNVSTARVNLDYTHISAPINGKVLLVATQEGQTVNSMQSAPTIVVLGTVDRMAVRAEISEADVPRVHPGEPVYFTVLGDSTDRWEARLASIDPAPDAIRTDPDIIGATTSPYSSSTAQTTSTAIYYYGNFDVDNADGKLLTYMTAQVHILLASAKDVITVPSEAVSAADADGKRFVDLVEPGGHIVRRAVTTGLNDKVRIEIKSGLQSGERVIAGRRSAQAAQPSFHMPPPPPGM